MYKGQSYNICQNHKNTYKSTNYKRQPVNNIEKFHVAHNLSNFKNTSPIGRLGEDIACKYLLRHGFKVLEQNYYRKVGEIDIIASKSGQIHFIEVKSVSYETIAALKRSVTHETWQPEELVHDFKLHQIAKTIDIWLSERSYDGPWYIDIVTVRIVPRETFATVKLLENITK